MALAMTRWQRTFEAPEPDLHASTDSAVIARGRYLAYGPARCVECHTSEADQDSVRAGVDVPLAGGRYFPIPVGTWITPNITPHPTLGIGRYTDGQLARV